MSIETTLLSWDGKSADDITAIYLQYHDLPAFSSEIISCISNPDLEKGATWLIKHYLESGGELKPQEIKTIYKHLLKLEHWEAKLHILQSIPKMPIAKAEKSMVERFLRQCLMSDNKFIRAWAYNGFYELSEQYIEYRQETRSFFTMALRDEAASVKARIRNILKRKSKGRYT